MTPEGRAKLSEHSRKLWQDPEFRERTLSARRAVTGAGMESWRRRRHIQIPHWVPKDMHDEYRDVAEQFDEFAAASWARKAKRHNAGNTW